jgi:NAD(P)-dependent dehydrogenase (short-subunit alcohol dehydrogenase family)
MDLTNASAIVTDGAGGFGSATVRRLAQMGAKVVIAGWARLDDLCHPPAGQ